MRIVSLVPSLTKTVCDFGLQKNMVGCTNYCIDPPNLNRTSARIGGTKDPNIEAIFSLAPTHVLVNEEENKPSDIAILQSRFNVLNTFPKSPSDVPDLLIKMGDFLACPEIGRQRAAVLQKALAELGANPHVFKSLGRRFAYLIWRDPWMAVSEDTYISRFLELFGMENVVKSDARYPVVEPKELASLTPDVLLMSSEPWPFRKRDAGAWREMVGDTAAKIYWIDGKVMSWYGATTLMAIEEICKAKQNTKSDEKQIAKKIVRRM